MASIREIKRRKAGIQSTAQMTKAMKLVSTIKYQKAKDRAEHIRPYFEKMYETVSSILSETGVMTHPELMPGDSPDSAVIVITSNRGLAGGYNANVVRLVTEKGPEKAHVRLYAVGGKGRDMLMGKGYVLEKDDSEVMEAPTYRDAQDIMEQVMEAYQSNTVSSVYLAYTYFKNTVTHIPKLLKLLPAEPERAAENENIKEKMPTAPMNFEPDGETVLGAILPQYMTSLIYGALMEAAASENGARMTAMDHAADNAEEMIEDLELKYNRARQGAITQEITEIVSGTEALA